MIHSQEVTAQLVTRVRKRDGRVMTFDKNRIAESIFRSARAAGCEDRHMAHELAEVVTLFISGKYENEIIGIDSIQDAVERILTDTGHSATAEAYRHYRHERDIKRESLEVSKVPALDVPLVDAAGRELIGPWDRSRIASALEKEARMDPGLAGEIARAVEEKVFFSGIKRLSTSLIRALVENELFERGLSIYQQRQRLLGVPTYDIEKMVTSDPQCASSHVGEMVMRQFTLHAVLSLDVSQSHLEGLIHIHDTQSPVCVGDGRGGTEVAELNDEAMGPLYADAAAGKGVRFVLQKVDDIEDDFRLPAVTVNLVAAAKDTPRERSDLLCLAIERGVAAAARAQGQRAAFASTALGSDVRMLGPIGVAGLNECASSHEKDAARLVPWIRKCVEAQYERGVKLVLTTECRGSSRFRSNGGPEPSRGIGISGTALQRLYVLDEFSELFHERVLLLDEGEAGDADRIKGLVEEARRLGSVHSLTVSSSHGSPFLRKNNR